MLDLYISELRRLRIAIPVFALAHLVVLAWLQQVTDLTAAPLALHIMMLVAACLAGAALALLQFIGYRQASRWIWLQHRPLHRARILAALVLAALTALALAQALPQLAMLAAQAHYTQRVVDARHVAGVFYLALAAFSAWLCCGWIVLHRSRWAFVALALPCALLLHLATATTVLALALVSAALLLGLLYTVFRPSRDARGDAPATVVGALALQVGFYTLLTWGGGSLLYQGALVVTRSHPMMVPPAGGYFAAARLDPRERLLAGLAGSTDARAPAWRAALPDAVMVGPTIRGHTVRSALISQGILLKLGADEKWTFSHDRMLYVGTDLRTDADLGTFGSGGRGSTAPFDAVPAVWTMSGGVVWLLDAHHLRRLERDGTLREVWRMDGGEILAGVARPVGARTLLVTNRRVVLAHAGLQEAAPASVPLPLPFGDLARVDAAPVAEGTLVSLLYGYRRATDGGPAAQFTYLVDTGGTARLVARHALGPDFPALFDHKDWWISPALYSLVVLPDLLVDNGDVPDADASALAPLWRTRPPLVLGVALSALLLAGAGAAWWTGRARTTPRERMAWCLACLLLGAPALLSLMVLVPREAPARVGARAQVSTA